MKEKYFMQEAIVADIRKRTCKSLTTDLQKCAAMKILEYHNRTGVTLRWDQSIDLETIIQNDLFWSWCLEQIQAPIWRFFI